MATSLEQHLLALEAFLRKDGDAPAWSRVLLVEDSQISHGEISKIPREALQAADRFSARFSELASRGYAWINLVGSGVLDNALIVSVETPRESSGAEVGKVAVNVSGPYLDRSGVKRWDLAGHLELS